MPGRVRPARPALCTAWTLHPTTTTDNINNNDNYNKNSNNNNKNKNNDNDHNKMNNRSGDDNETLAGS